MPRRSLNLGILAHVDAGKTTLTERLLYAAGVIDEVGSVDAGTTRTDTLPLERQRGITIRSAVVSFAVRDITVNLIDTPGHPDFIAEVERALSVLDGAVLVISAVEGVQPQARVLMRALRRLAVPTILFINKIDRRGAGCGRVLAEIAGRLTPAIVPVGTVRDEGTPAAVFMPSAKPAPALPPRLAGEGPYPVFCGSAITGAGVESLMDGIAGLLPTAGRDISSPVSGRVFKIERGPAGQKIAYARIFTGTVRVRQPLRFGSGGGRKVTAIEVFGDGEAARRESVAAGEIARLYGLAEIQVGDMIGAGAGGMAGQVSGREPARFAPPTLQTVVSPPDPAAAPALWAALTQLAEQDPLITVRQDDQRREICLSLYGEVQKEVIEATLAAEYGVEASFRQTSVICVERPAGTGAACERKGEPGNPFLATVGLRVEPGAPGSGVEFRREVSPGAMPPAFFRAVEDTVRDTLRQGLRGWEVTDCVVTMTHSGYAPRQSHAHQRFSKAMSSTGEDFRGLTPLVLMAALLRAGTVVCEPVHHFRLEAPGDCLPRLLPAMSRLAAVPLSTESAGESVTLTGGIPAARIHELRQELPALTSGEGTLECDFDRYQPVTLTRPPVRPRIGPDPLNRPAYLSRAQRAPGGIPAECRAR